MTVLPNGGNREGRGKFGGYILMAESIISLLFYVEEKVGSSPPRLSGSTQYEKQTEGNV